MKTILSLTTYFLIREMFIHMPVLVRIWVAVLLVTMLITPMFFFEHATARWMVGMFLAAGMILGWMHMKMGISKAMGVAHIVWLVPMSMIFLDLSAGEFAGSYFLWLAAAAVIGTLCLLIDAFDVVRYMLGNRAQIAPPAP